MPLVEIELRYELDSYQALIFRNWSLRKISSLDVYIYGPCFPKIRKVFFFRRRREKSSSEGPKPTAKP